jgi:hypothetical protein
LTKRKVRRDRGPPERVDVESLMNNSLPTRRAWPSGEPRVYPTPRSWVRREAEA